MTSIKPQIDANKRLIVLRSLNETDDGRMNETMLSRALEIYGYSLSREQVRDLLKWLDERDAIDTEMAGGVVMIATLTRRGSDHVNRRGPPIEGIDQPSRR